MAAVEKDPYSISYITKPTKAVQMRAFTQNPDVIELIDEPCDKIQIASVTLDPEYITIINNPCEEAQIIAVKQVPRYLKDIKNPSNRVLLAAMQTDPEIIEMVDYIPEYIQQDIIKKRPDLIGKIKHLDKLILTDIVKNKTHIAKYLDLGEDYQYEIIKKEVSNFVYIKNPTFDIKEAVLSINPELYSSPNMGIDDIGDPRSQNTLLLMYALEDKVDLIHAMLSKYGDNVLYRAIDHNIIESVFDEMTENEVNKYITDNRDLQMYVANIDIETLKIILCYGYDDIIYPCHPDIYKIIIDKYDLSKCEDFFSKNTLADEVQLYIYEKSHYWAGKFCGNNKIIFELLLENDLYHIDMYQLILSERIDDIKKVFYTIYNKYDSAMDKVISKHYKELYNDISRRGRILSRDQHTEIFNYIKNNIPDYKDDTGYCDKWEKEFTRF